MSRSLNILREGPFADRARALRLSFPAWNLRLTGRSGWQRIFS